MKPTIYTWDDNMTLTRNYAVKLPMGWFARLKSRWSLTWLMVKLIWGIGAKRADHMAAN